MPGAEWAISAGAEPSAEWDSFVSSRSDASVYLHSGWSLLARDVFGHRPWFIEARDQRGSLCGILPVVHQKSLLGNFATSLAFFNYGGALSADESVTTALMHHACALADKARCSYVEFRDIEPRAGKWAVRTDKVNMVLDLPVDEASLSKQLGAKLRSQIKRAERENPEVRTGGGELLDDFYDVFCRNMRDLGTPVYPRRFFAAILERFPRECLLISVRRAGQPAAAGFLVMANGRAEIPWAACRVEFKPLGFNMRLYWEALRAAVGRGCRSFDFGRSTVDSGTYQFKKQWGARPVQLYWHRWEATPHAEGRARRYAASIWQRLPLGVANKLGPIVSPGLPW